MYILTILGEEDRGAYSVTDEYGEQILYIFEEEDDAVRFAMMLEDSGSPEMNIVEVEEELLYNVCEIHGYEYAIITKDDIVVPPNQYDSI
jgi:hypothetical protein